MPDYATNIPRVINIRYSTGMHDQFMYIASGSVSEYLIHINNWIMFYKVLAVPTVIHVPFLVLKSQGQNGS